MKITICKTAGLCGGASRAYNSVIKSLEENGKAFVYKELLHNEALINDLKSKGAHFDDNIKNANNEDIVVLRAHGEEKYIYDYLNENNISYIDAICTNVKHVHNVALEKQNEGYRIIVVGKYKNGEYHDEIKSLVSFLKDPILIHSIESAMQVKLNHNEKLLNDTVCVLSNKAKELEIEFDYKNTICNFPILNIQESIKLASVSDISIVVGSSNSSNTTELYNAVKNLSFTIFSNDLNYIKNQVENYVLSNNLDRENVNICILAGASTLKENLQNLKILLEK